MTSLDWQGYPILRFEDCPAITPVVVQRPDERSTGAGEETMAAAAAAIANAFFDATGRRHGPLPLHAGPGAGGPEARLNNLNFVRQVATAFPAAPEAGYLQADTTKGSNLIMAIWDKPEPGSNSPPGSPPRTVGRTACRPAPRLPRAPHRRLNLTRPRSPKERSEMKESIIASGLSIEGKIIGTGHVRVAGKFKGDVQVEGNLHIDAGAQGRRPGARQRSASSAANCRATSKAPSASSCSRAARSPAT